MDSLVFYKLKKRISVDHNTGCWNWSNNKNDKGYGRYNHKGTVWLAHRLSFLSAKGIDPGPLCVLHICDNPSCINPDHLMLGTKGDNNLDMARKGRRCDQVGTHNSPRGDNHWARLFPEKVKRGEQNNQAKLSDFAVHCMRVTYKLGLSQRLLAICFDIHVSTVNRIVTNKTRKLCKTN